MFQDDQHTEEERRKMQDVYAKIANAVDESLKSYVLILGHLHQFYLHTNQDIHVVPALLLMDYADAIDGVSVLARSGSA